MAVVIGVAWYSRDMWERLRNVAPDGDDLEQTHEDWLIVFDRALAQLRTAGVKPERIPIDVDAFLDWCGANREQPDSSARAGYASEVLRRRHESEESGER